MIAKAPASTSPVARGTVLLLTAAALWSTNGVLIKSLYAAGMGGTNIAAFRSLLAAAFLLPFALQRWKPMAEPLWAAGTVLMFTCMSATFVLATTKTTAANAIILQYTAPAWVFLISPWIVGERAESKQWMAFAVSMLAVVFIFGTQYTSDLGGMLIGLSSGMVFGTQIVFFRRVRALDPVVLAFLCCAGSGVLLVGPAFWFEGCQLSAANLWLIVLTGVAQFGVPYVIYAAGVQRATAQRAVLIIMLEPVLNPLWVFLICGEAPHWGTTVGGGFILLSVCYLSLSRTGSEAYAPSG